MNAYTFAIYKLRFSAPVHFSDAMDDYGHSLQTYHSDSMYAALTAASAAVGATSLTQEPNAYVISSLFPYAKTDDGTDLYFFPKPLGYFKMPLTRLKEHKVLKKVLWLDLHYFSEILHGKSLYEVAQAKDIQYGTFISSKKIKEPISQKWIAARVQVPRFIPGENNDIEARPFFMERMQFSDSSGLYFLAMGDENALKTLENQLNILQDFGLGTDRNVGYGHFTWKSDYITIHLPQSEYYMCCGIFIPDKEWIENNQLIEKILSFKLQRRGGWITTHPFNKFRKNDIYAFDVGTIIHHPKNEFPLILGRNVNLTPKVDFIGQQLDHPIIRNGKTIFLPILK